MTSMPLPSFVFRPRQTPLILPPAFPAQTPAPRFAEGVAVRWLLLSDCDRTDSGIVIGRCFAFARHRRQWGWQYWILLERNAASSVLIDTAWEEDLEQVEAAT
ncbi:MAG: hypothetical protein KME07_13065 [Pegethrix bostrychoides GSE-TBD4-15B]|jgi:hypothetical protein|uniref:Uncharacterized protein n=1 Tax=Pegethrix bostrychoides GSE-TBD4-15B TaxID=2839662 RepID=A0A951U515_9CYAN|nr:hypothetical protein [Pegethrix bostrychoides GSE-TBD4-15B]